MAALKLEATADDPVTDFLVRALRSEAANLSDAGCSKEASDVYCQAAESIATAAVKAGDHPLRYANIRYWEGGCPECGSEGSLVHVYSAQWVVCHEHRLAWYIGDNLYSGWRNLQPDEHEANAQMLESYTVIDDALPTPASLCLACGLAAGQHERWCIHAHEHLSARSPAEALPGGDAPDWLQVAMPAGASDETDQDDPEIDLEVWGDL